MSSEQNDYSMKKTEIKRYRCHLFEINNTFQAAYERLIASRVCNKPRRCRYVEEYLYQ